MISIGMNDEQIQQCTKLSLDKIRQLRKVVK